MEEKRSRSNLLPWFAIPVGGLFVLALCYIGYFASYMLVESIFFPNTPTAVPAGVIRNSYTLVLLVIYFILLRTKISDLYKAILLIGPVSMLIIAAILALYLTPVLAIVSTFVIAVICIFLLYKYKKPWFYYYALAISIAAAIAYAWPRA